MALATQDTTVLLIAPAAFTVAPRFKCFNREKQRNRLIIRPPSHIREVPKALVLIKNSLFNQFDRGQLDRVRWIQAVTVDPDHVASGADERLFQTVKSMIRALEARNIVVEEPFVFDPYGDYSAEVDRVAGWIREVLPPLPALRDLKDDLTLIPLDAAAAIAGQARGKPYSERRLLQMRKDGQFTEVPNQNGQVAIIANELYLKFCK